MSKAQNYARVLSQTLCEIENQISLQGKKPSLLLHACCAPCSSFVIESLRKYFDISIYFYNPNIHPQSEYARRLDELKLFLPRFSSIDDMLEEPQSHNALSEPVPLIEAEYNTSEYFDAVNAERDFLQTEAERGERCRRCYKLRMEKSYAFALENNFDFFTTTLSISPHKDAAMINEIGAELEASYIAQAASAAPQTPATSYNAAAPRTKYLFADFKKNDGFKKSLKTSSEYGLYRQDYCGCVYSKQNTNHSIEEAKCKR